VPPPGYRPKPDIAERRARVLQLRIEHRPYAEIAVKLGITPAAARKDYERAFAALKATQLTAAAEARRAELAKLDALEQAAWEVLRRRHIIVQQGRIAGRFTGQYRRDPETRELLRDDLGKPIPVLEEIEDDQPVLAAIDRLERIAARRARLLGLDAPVKVEVDDARLAAIRRIAERLAARRVGDMEPGGAGPAAEDPPGAGSGGKAD
jgi:DNA-binding CsgD family transcriptional regulator